MSDSEEKSVDLSNMEKGDICVYEINYDKNDNDFKIKINSAKNVDITVADAYAQHPYLMTSTIKDINMTLHEDDEFEVGDEWYKN